MNVLLRVLAWTFAVALALAPVVAVLNGWLASEHQRVDAETLRNAVAPHAAAGFFAVDLALVQRDVAALDWVASVEVRKRWPNRIELVVHEHQPFALWGDSRLLSARGELFPLPAGGAPADLPRLDARDDQVAEAVAAFQQAQPLFAGHGADLVGLRLSPRGSWTFRLADGATVMAGRGDPLPRVQRFVPLMATLRKVDGRPLQRADLRYANGFALRWGAVPDVGTDDADEASPRQESLPAAPAQTAAPAGDRIAASGRLTNHESRITNHEA
jgi:cell division protein FtsQ